MKKYSSTAQDCSYLIDCKNKGDASAEFGTENHD